MVVKAANEGIAGRGSRVLGEWRLRCPHGVRGVARASRVFWAQWYRAGEQNRCV